MQVLLHLPDEIAQRFRSAIPARQRSAYVQKLLEAALPPEDKDAWLARVATEAQAEFDAHPELQAEAEVWDGASGDGLDNLAPFDEADLLPHLRQA